MSIGDILIYICNNYINIITRFFNMNFDFESMSFYAYFSFPIIVLFFVLVIRIIKYVCKSF